MSPSRHSDTPTLRMVSTVRRRLRQEFLRISGKCRNIVHPYSCSNCEAHTNDTRVRGPKLQFSNLLADPPDSSMKRSWFAPGRLGRSVFDQTQGRRDTEKKTRIT